MQISSLLGAAVTDAEHRSVGTVTDVRLQISADIDDLPEVVGFVVSPRTRSSYLGYERTDTRAPAMLAVLARWRHRGTFLAAWSDVARIGSDAIMLRPGYARQSAMLR